LRLRRPPPPFDLSIGKSTKYFCRSFANTFAAYMFSIFFFSHKKEKKYICKSDKNDEWQKSKRKIAQNFSHEQTICRKG